jgi:predicted transport protein
MKSCLAFRTSRNFCCFDIYAKHFFLALDLDPALADGCAFARDVSGVGHQGTGDLQLRIEGPEQLEKAEQLALLAYQTSLGA